MIINEQMRNIKTEERYSYSIPKQKTKQKKKNEINNEKKNENKNKKMKTTINYKHVRTSKVNNSDQDEN